jgi:cysteine desulfurase
MATTSTSTPTPSADTATRAIAVPASVKVPIFMDNHSTTPVDPRVLETMLPYFTQHFGNAASRNHVFGWTAEAAVDNARDQIAALIGGEGKEIVLTSRRDRGQQPRDQGRRLLLQEEGRSHHHREDRAQGGARHLQAARARGLSRSLSSSPIATAWSTPEQVAAAIDDETILLVSHHVRQQRDRRGPAHRREIGAAICQEPQGTLFHSDATQAAGKVPVDVDACNVDLVSLTAHKMYGPKGVGALYVRRKPRVRLDPQLDGGGHERGMRSGTLNVPGIVGLGKACEVAKAEMETEATRLGALRERLARACRRACPSLRQRRRWRIACRATSTSRSHSSRASRSSWASRTSRCRRARPARRPALEPSYVLKALGVGDELAHSSIRFGSAASTPRPRSTTSSSWWSPRCSGCARCRRCGRWHQDGIDLTKVKWTPH